MGLMNHVAGSKCLLEIDGILKQLDIPYFLMQGTALGAYRDKGFTATEKDIDLGILYEHLLPKFNSLMGIMMIRGFDVEAFTMPFTRPKTLVVFKEYGGYVVHADLVGMVPWDGLRFTSAPVRDYIEEPYCIVHRADIVENYRKSIVLWGREFWLPAEIEYYLFCEYGPKWMEPRDDHLSRTRVYNFIQREGIRDDYLEKFVEPRPEPRGAK